MRKHLSELYDKFYGQDIFIMGGGYSVNDINLEFLDDKPTIAINNAYEFLPNATALFWCDSSWIGREYHKIMSHKCELRFYSKTHGSGHIENDTLAMGESTVLLQSGDYGYDPVVDNVMGNNSGVQALNLGINMGAKTIYLLGFDMRDDPLKRQRTHFHDSHTLTIRHDTYSRLFIPSMNALYREVKARNINVDIINCSPTSALTCFKKKMIGGLHK